MLGHQIFPACAFAPAETQAAQLPAIAVAPAAAAAPLAEAPPATPKPIRTRSGMDVKVLLSEREDQILHYLVAGSPNKLIARGLNITEATVKVHIKGLLRKLNAANRTQAAIWAMRNTA